MEPLEFLSPTGLHPEHLPLHAACPGTLPGCEEPRIPPCTCPRPAPPSLFVLPNRPSEDPGSLLGPCLCGEDPEPPLLATWAQADTPGLPKAKDLGRVGPDAPVPGTRPSPGAGAPGRSGPSGSGQPVLTLRERLIFPDGW